MLKQQYQLMLQYSNPAVPDKEKPDWARAKSFRRTIGALETGTLTTARWTEAQDDLLLECKSHSDLSWANIQKQSQARFEVQRSCSAQLKRYYSLLGSQNPEPPL